MWPTLIANGLTFGALLFLIASGLTLIFGVMRIVNLAHGSLYLVSAYVGTSVARATGSFWLAIVAGFLTGAVVGFVMQRFFLHRFEGQLLPQVLLTMGFLLVIADLVLLIWGGHPQTLPEPSFLRGPLRLGMLILPKYRVFVAVVSLLIAFVSWIVLDKTRVGAIVRAVVDDAETAAAVGIRVPFVIGLMFLLGSGLAGLGGLLGAPLMGVYPGIDMEVLTLALAVVIIGGLGSLPGTLGGSLLVGLADNLGKALVPELSYVTFFAPMVLILIFRPKGLFSRG